MLRVEFTTFCALRIYWGPLAACPPKGVRSPSDRPVGGAPRLHGWSTRRRCAGGCYNVCGATALLLPLRMNATIREAIETIALTALVFLLLHATLQNYQVKGPSMDPQLTNDELVLVNKAVYLSIDVGRVARYLPWVEAEEGEKWFPFHAPRRGDVVVFENPQDPTAPDFVKRVIGEPGDTVEIDGGQVLINGEVLAEPYIKRPSQDTRRPVVVGPNEYFVMGDNRLQSEDSRVFGTVPRDKIVGKVWLGYWPLNRFGLLQVRWGW